MLRIILTGCLGRMGKAVTQLCASRDDVKIVAGVDIMATAAQDYPVYKTINEVTEEADVIIDFSNAKAMDDIVTYGVEKSIPMVLATTGYSEEQLARLQKESEKVAIFRSGNMSLGISVLSELVSRAAKVLGEGYDVEIIEKHHNQKLDAPSGTALMLYEAANEALPYDAQPTYDRHSVRQKRDKREIGIHSIRGGTIVGEHEVIFAGYQETLSLSHTCLSREVFAGGAVKAAWFMKDKANGLFTMKDVVSEILK